MAVTPDDYHDGMTAEVGRLSPEPGLTMTGLVRPWLKAYREAVSSAEASTSEGHQHTQRLLQHLVHVSQDQSVPANSNRRAIRFAYAAWLMALATETLPLTSPVADGVRWLMGDDLGLPDSLPSQPLKTLVEKQGQDALIQAFPYMLDIHGEGSRRVVLKDTSAATQRQKRKEGGVYYTPSDVADHMIKQALSRNPNGNILDPACGTGVFIIRTLVSMVRLGTQLTPALKRLHGIDINAEAVDSAALALMLQALLLEPCNSDPTALWTACSQQFLVADALRLTEHDIARHWPSTCGRFGVVIGNPPYAKAGALAQDESIQSRYRSLEDGRPSTNLYLPFVELGSTLLDQQGVVALVVPLSIGTSSLGSVRRVRAHMVSQEFSWAFSFFDRTPDSLFGDDVKQRNAIVIGAQGTQRQVSTTRLSRWTSRTRSGLFGRQKSVCLGRYDFTNGVPMVGSDEEVHALSQLGLVHSSLGGAVVRGGSANSVVVAPTAYNWLSIERDDNQQPGHSRETIRLSFSSPEQADAAYALLSCRLTYWLWRVTGDGFHVTRRFLESLPYPLLTFDPASVHQLAQLGRELAASPLAEVVSMNRGRATVTRCPWSADRLIQETDVTAISQVGLDPSFSRFLREYVRETALVDQADTQRAEPGSRVLAAWA